MLVDAETLELAPGVERLLGPEGLKTELFSCLIETNTPVCESAAEARGRARPAARRRPRGCCERGARGRRGRHPSVLAGGGAGDRRRAALPEDARGARPEAPPPARLRAARARRHGELRRRACGRSRRSFPGFRTSSRSRSTRRTCGGEETGALSARAARLGELPRGGAAAILLVAGGRGRPRSTRPDRTTRAAGGTPARTRASERSRCGSPTSRRTSAARRRSRR